jgi:hypothetical protein
MSVRADNGSAVSYSPGLMAGVALISGASLMLELTLTRIFSVVLFYHFAFLVVSLALFGIGVAGIVLYVRQRAYQPEKMQRALTFHALGFGLTVIVSLWVVLTKKVAPGFGWESIFDLSILYLVAALPFFFSGMCLTLAVTLLKEQVSRVYFFDLSGAALGCLLTIPALNFLGGPTAVLAAGALGASSAVLFMLKRGRRFIVVLSMAVLLWGVVGLDAGVGIFKVPSVKAIDERQVIFSRWNSFSRVTVSRTPEDFHWMNIDSDAATRIFNASAYKNGSRANMRFSETRLASLVYAVRNGGHALIIGPGGGADVIGALTRGVAKVTGVELNPIIAEDVMKEKFSDYSGGLYTTDNVEVVVGEGRSYVRRAEKQFDSIQATLVDTWAATNAGAFTLSENTLYTQEAFADFLEHLTDQGVLSMTRWLRHPPREFVRLISLGVAALNLRDIRNCSRHFFVAADQRMASFLLKRTPFTAEELVTLRDTCRRDGLRVIYDPDGSFRRGDLIGELIRSEDPSAIFEKHSLDISPPSDNRPFFFYTIKPGDFLGQMFGGAKEKNDLGVQILASLLLIVAAAVLLFILIPLFVFKRQDLKGFRLKKSLSLAFFISIGVGFIGLEISWMQHFVLFLGHPIYALGVVLFVLLLASGVGSFLTSKIESRLALKNLWPSVLMLGAVVLIYGFLLGPLFRAFVGLPLFVRILVSAILLAGPGLLMGRMMPLGIKTMTANFPEMVPWAWGINGAASVFGSVLAVAVSMNLGFRATQIVAALVYFAGVALFSLAFRQSTSKSQN